MHVYTAIKKFSFILLHINQFHLAPLILSLPHSHQPHPHPQASYGLAQSIAYQLRQDLAPPLIYVKAGTGNTAWGTG